MANKINRITSQGSIATTWLDALTPQTAALGMVPMIRKPHKILCAAAASVILGVSAHGSEPTEIKEFSEEITWPFCENSSYIDCLGISSTVCRESFKTSFLECPRRYIQELDYVDPVCMTESFFDIAGISGETARSCDEIIRHEVELMHKQIIQSAPNKAKQKGTP